MKIIVELLPEYFFTLCKEIWDNWVFPSELSFGDINMTRYAKTATNN